MADRATPTMEKNVASERAVWVLEEQGSPVSLCIHIDNVHDSQRGKFQRYVPEQQWIAVTERLPEVQTTVLVLCRNRSYPNRLETEPRIGRLDDDGDWFETETHELRGVAHWMPLPALPDDGGTNG